MDLMHIFANGKIIGTGGNDDAKDNIREMTYLAAKWHKRDHPKETVEVMEFDGTLVEVEGEKEKVKPLVRKPLLRCPA